MRVALAHDYLTQHGGAERVALLLTRIFPGAPLYTSVYSSGSTYEGFKDVEVRTSRLQRVGAFRRDPRLALLALPHAWRSMHVADADVVIASSTGWSHGISVPAHTRKVVYCHNPPRWLYQPGDYMPNRYLRGVVSAATPYLKGWDRSAAASADLYVVNSTSVARRVKAAYGIEAEVLHPPVAMDADAEQEPVPGIEPGYWLTIARGRGYKNTQAVIDGTRALPGARLVIAGSASRELGAGEDHVSAVGIVSDAQLRWLYANARGLVSVSQEDFGLTPLEANAFGTPVAVLRAGGFLDSTAEGVSGTFIEAPTANAVRDTLRDFPEFTPELVRKHAANFSEDVFSARLREIASFALV
ncbi:glycosyltransferase [Pengzhenrongella sicca]|uniref:D-inositol 3-phosphate glycosyltransferase n=1 Tax=Pengzhenrongella sicca TaxID=2819238 RepID=A0A8A4ZCD5_9MICO|nr:glycosyltransferase [Pengzhenrongella sicca]QTE29660.1 glycosyltransferase [Pengzhenrongella sicca]